MTVEHVVGVMGEQLLIAINSSPRRKSSRHCSSLGRLVSLSIRHVAVGGVHEAASGVNLAAATAGEGSQATGVAGRASRGMVVVVEAADGVSTVAVCVAAETVDGVGAGGAIAAATVVVVVVMG